MLPVGDAGGRAAKAPRVPAGVRLSPLPPCPPELRPAGHRRPLAREGLADLDFGHLVGRAAGLRGRRDRPAHHPEVVGGAGAFQGAVNL